MSKIIKVNLGELVPNGSYVYEKNLEQARQKWDQYRFENGLWINVYDLDGQLFLPDGNHRVYIAYFEKDIKTAQAKLAELSDFPEYSWDDILKPWRHLQDTAAKDGVHSVEDLEGRMRPGSWQNALSEEIKTRTVARGAKHYNA